MDRSLLVGSVWVGKIVIVDEVALHKNVRQFNI